MRTQLSSFLFIGSFLGIVVVSSALSIHSKGTGVDGSIFDAPDCACENGKCVTDFRGKTKCICNPRYVLQTEGVCKECYCGKQGKCYFNYVNNVYLKKCLCDRGYAEKEGTCIDCQCGENSKCEFEGDNKICYCLEGYSDLEGVCTTCDCGEFGECEFRNGEKHCLCYENYLVHNGKCEECDCGNGDCSFDGAGNKVCKCNEGFSLRGDRCEACDCGEYSQGCSFDSAGNKVCACPSGLAQRLGVCATCNCGTHSRSCLFDSTGKKVCTCETGFAQNRENCQSCNCGANSVSCLFGEDGNQVCGCKPGFAQKGNLCTATCVQDDNCKHDGRCVNEGNRGDKFCKCKNGLTGDKCDIIVDCVNGLDAVCRNGGGVCKYNPKTEKAYCECPQGAFFNPISKKCQVCDCGENSVSCIFGGDGIQQCSCKPGFAQKGNRCTATCIQDDNCKNDGRCVNEGNKGDKFCKCKNGLTGDKCDIIIDCVNGLDAVCRNGGGVCKYNPQTEKAYCECPQGAFFNPVTKQCQGCSCGENSVSCSFGEEGNQVCLCKPGFAQKGNRCAETCTRNDDCKNDGRCINEGNQGNNFCKCKNGLTGDKCDIIVDCVNGLDAVCRNGGGVCKYNPQTEKAYCECPSGMSFNPTSKRCEGCNCGPNSVSCVFGEDGSEVCRCKSGFAQKGKNTCSATCVQDDNCKNDGRCANEGNRGDKFCKCKNGLTGDKCDIIVDCVNGLDAVCRNGGGVCKYNPKTEKAYCECPQGAVFNRITKQCQGCNCGENSVTCSFDEQGNQVCLCNPGFAQKGNGCAETCIGHDDCKNDGRCTIEDQEDYFCKCRKGLIGDKCDIIVDCVNGLDAVCRNGGGVCKYNTKTEKAYCECSSGKSFNPSSKRCEGCNCGPNSVSCVFGADGNEICRCKPGFSQRGKNTCSATCTEDYHCMHGGKCVNEGNRGDKFCLCKDGLKGDKCEVIVDCVNGLDEVCRNAGALCNYNPKKEKAFCECAYGYTFNPATRQCQICSCGQSTLSCEFLDNGRRLCRCRPGFGQKGDRCAATCTHDGQCKYGSRCVSEGNQGYKFCRCEPGFTGDFCDTVVHCEDGLDAVCRNGGGVCKYDYVTELSHCFCERGSQFNYIAKECQVCNCGEHALSCMFSDDDGSQMCRCQPGYRQRGLTCRASCDNDNDCENGGKCVSEGRNGAKFCNCREGFIGDKCEVVVGCKEDMIMRCRSAGAVCSYNSEKQAPHCKCPQNRIFNPYSEMCEGIVFVKEISAKSFISAM